MSTPQTIKHTAAYAAKDIDTLHTLEISLERDEADWAARIISLEQVTVDGANATAATYQEDDDARVGHLTLSEYTDDIDAHSRIAIHTANKETFLFKGAAFVKDVSVKVLVFREKPKS